MANTYGDMVTDALIENRIARAGDVVNTNQMAIGIRQLNRLIDLWNAERPKMFRTFLNDFTLIANKTAHTIGPSSASPDFAVATNRPVAIEQAALNIGGSPASYLPIEVQDWRFYANRYVPGLKTSIPFVVYYDPGFPLGNLYFWPVPTAANGVRLWIRAVLVSVVQTDAVSLPEGYELALMLTLAELLAASLGQTVSEKTVEHARQARAVIQANNTESPRIATRDDGMHSRSSQGGMTNSQFLSRGPY